MKSPGQGSWVFRWQRNGKRPQTGLGSAKVVKLAKAREFAAKARVAIAEGRDPKEAIGRGKMASPTDWSLSAVVERTFEKLKPSLKGGGEAGRWMSPVSLHILPKLGKKSVEDITAEDIRATLSPIWTTKHATALKAFRRLKIALERAADEGADVDEAVPVKAKRLLGKVPKKAEHISHTKFEAIPDLYERICELPQTPATLALRLILLTAHRGGPVRHARLEQFDLDAGVWTVPANAMKGREGAGEDVKCPLFP